ncbi:MAG: hypothetical protein ABSC24_00505 [Verrucomicrobiota bacterium]|jgi:hypothetical protein
MFQRKELAQLRLQKERLVLQSDANRQQLVSEWRRLQSSDIWLGEILRLTRRRPLWIVTLVTVAGTLMAKTLRKPRTAISGIGRLGKYASMAFSVWRLFRRKWLPS